LKLGIFRSINLWKAEGKGYDECTVRAILNNSSV